MNLRLTLAAVAIAVAVGVDAAPRVHHGVHRTLRQSGKADIVVIMKAKPAETLRRLQSTSFASRGEKIESMVNQLDDLAQSSQAGIDRLLAQESGSAQPLFEAEHRSWAMNGRLFNGASYELVERLSSLADVELIREQEIADLSVEQQSSTQANTIQWGVDRIEATRVWADGNIGQNTVVGVIDTGARHTHEILRRNFLGAYGWYDPDNQADTPFDTNGHGTHVAGTIAGSKGYGVAPGTKWMACVGCPERCPEFNLVKCGEFMTCPTDTKGENRDCSKAPNVINNSWGGVGGRPWYRPVVETWRNAGIIPVFAQGNAGGNCSSAGSPGDLDNVIGVGAMGQNETLAFFSGRGPAVGTGLLKPDIAAPGLFIASASNVSDTEYRTISGTSMASPHVAGAVALLISGDPTLNYDKIYSLLTSTTDQSNFNSSLSPNRANVTDICGDIKETTFPNYHFGHGRMNIFSAYQGFRAPVPTTPAPTTLAPTPAPTPAPTTVAPTQKPTPAPGFCPKFKDAFTCQVWFWCNWDKKTKLCDKRF